MKFSLRALFGVMSAVAVYVALVFATPPLVSLILLSIFSYLLGPAIFIGVIHDRGWMRSFWIGCLIPAAIPYVFLTYYGAIYSPYFWSGESLVGLSGSGGNSASYVFAGAHLAIVLSGASAAVMHTLIDHRLTGSDPAAVPPFKPDHSA